MKIYEKVMQNMTPETLAELGVRMINVDNRRLFYVTSSGQLYPIEQYNEAVRHEYNWLMTDDGMDKKEDTESVESGIQKDGKDN